MLDDILEKLVKNKPLSVGELSDVQEAIEIAQLSIQCHKDSAAYVKSIGSLDSYKLKKVAQQSRKAMDEKIVDCLKKLESEPMNEDTNNIK